MMTYSKDTTKTMADTQESIDIYITYPDTAANVKLVLKNKKTGAEIDPGHASFFYKGLEHVVREISRMGAERS